MSISLSIPAAFSRYTQGKTLLECSSRNISELLAEINQKYPELGSRIKDETGHIRGFINVYVNDEDIRFLGGDSFNFQDGDEVTLVPAIAGGQ